MTAPDRGILCLLGDPGRVCWDRARLMFVRDAEVRYVEHAGAYLAYSVFGEGPHDVAVSQTRFPIDLMWELPQLASFMEALGSFARVIVWDARGNGASDPIPEPGASVVEMLCDDMLAVLDAVEADRVTALDMLSGQGLMAAAAYPERVRSLILVSVRPSFPELRRLSPTQRKKLAMKMREPERLRYENPRVAHDPVLQRWWGRATRLMNSPDEMVRNLEHAAEMDLESVLPAIRAPTLVFHRSGNRAWDIETSREAAARIPGARFVELPGAENDIFLGDTADVLAEIERFVGEPDTDIANDRPLATVLFTDIVSSTEQLAQRGDVGWRRVLDNLDRAVDRAVSLYRGRVVKQLGDGTLATFDGPARAVRCAAAICDAATEQGITLRAGLHTGEIEIRTADVAGIAVHIASRIAAIAHPGEILVSRTVVDLTGGSGLQFEPRGEHQLKGVPGTWPIFAAR